MASHGEESVLQNDQTFHDQLHVSAQMAREITKSTANPARFFSGVLMALEPPGFFPLFITGFSKGVHPENNRFPIYRIGINVISESTSRADGRTTA